MSFLQKLDLWHQPAQLLQEGAQTIGKAHMLGPLPNAAGTQTLSSCWLAKAKLNPLCLLWILHWPLHSELTRPADSQQDQAMSSRQVLQASRMRW